MSATAPGISDPFEREGAAEVETRERQLVDSAGSDYSRKRPEPLEEIRIELRRALGGLILRARNRHGGGHRAVRIEAGIDRQHVCEAANQQSGSDQQQERHGHFSRNQQASSAGARRSCRPAPGLGQRITQIGTRSLQRREQPEYHRRHERQRKREQQDGSIDADRFLPRQRDAVHRAERAHEPRGEQKTGNRTAQAEHQTFEKELPDQAVRDWRPARRGPRARFAAPHRGRAWWWPHCAQAISSTSATAPSSSSSASLEPLGELVLQPNHVDANGIIVGAVLLLQLLRDRVHLGSRRG